MAKQTIASKAEKHFAGNPTRKEVHATSDGFLFDRKENANAHATTLEDKKVETFTKSGKVEDINVEAVDLSDAEKAAAKVEADKKAATAKVAEAKKASDAKKEADKKEAAKKKAAAKKEADKTEKAQTNTAGAKKHPANTGADQKTAK